MAHRGKVTIGTIRSLIGNTDSVPIHFFILMIYQ